MMMAAEAADIFEPSPPLQRHGQGRRVGARPASGAGPRRAPLPKCGRAGRLEVHHVLELAHGGTNDMNNLNTLCRACHIDTHRRELPAGGDEWLALVREL